MLTSKLRARELGLQGEDRAARYLEDQGVKIIERHFRTRWGELDLVARHKDAWVFIEVKTRRKAYQPSALDAISPAKQKKMVMAALSFMKKRGLQDVTMRFDVVAIEADHVEWIPNAFEPTHLYTF